MTSPARPARVNRSHRATCRRAAAAVPVTSQCGTDLSIRETNVASNISNYSTIEAADFPLYASLIALKIKYTLKC